MEQFHEYVYNALCYSSFETLDAVLKTVPKTGYLV